MGNGLFICTFIDTVYFTEILCIYSFVVKTKLIKIKTLRYASLFAEMSTTTTMTSATSTQRLVTDDESSSGGVIVAIVLCPLVLVILIIAAVVLFIRYTSLHNNNINILLLSAFPSGVATVDSPYASSY